MKESPSFIITTEDIDESIKRCIRQAKDAGVSSQELVATTIYLQESTARGGAMIGNGLKNIFTRLVRANTLSLLKECGLETKKSDGKIKPAIQILKELSAILCSLSDSKKSKIKERISGIFHITILSALLADLSKTNSSYEKILSQLKDNKIYN